MTMRRFFPLWAGLCALLATAGSGLAQDAAATPAASTTDVSYFFVTCEDRAILDLNGTIDAGYDVYVQVFRDLGAAGTALTGLLRVPVTGTFQVSPPLPFPETERIIFGQFASARLIIARETDPNNVMFQTIVDDVQDGCANPQFAATATSVIGSGTGGTPATVTDPATGQTLTIISDSGIYRPDGGKLNQVFARPREEVVQIGARASEDKREEGRTSNPGLIFAECDNFPAANPGRLFDTDGITIFWSWFARTPAQVQSHLDNAIYDITLNGRSIQPVQVSEIRQLDDGNYWVFYTASLGSGFRPDTYGVVFNLSWRAAIRDGFDRFGPGTRNESFRSTCTFTIEPNPYGVQVDYVYPPQP
ncbi:MAG: hypothetical protein MUE40_17360 [Anaerolineae bacterium]|jgi:hypothetical protein|nr:hypothetical protein [Anaerolineae bacterium]